MRLSEDIFSYGMGQLPVATSSIVPPEPFRSWGKRATQLEAELADYKAGIEGMHDAIRDLRAENEMLRDRARQLRRIIEVNAPDVDIEYNLDALKEGG